MNFRKLGDFELLELSEGLDTEDRRFENIKKDWRDSFLDTSVEWKLSKDDREYIFSVLEGYIDLNS
jgi:hypothetical protein